MIRTSSPVPATFLGRRLSLRLGCLLLALAASGPALAQDAEFLNDAISLEQRLLREDLSEYDQAGAAEAEARQAMNDSMSQLAALARQRPSSEADANNLRRAEVRASEAMAMWRAAGARSAAVVARIEGRLQRLRLLAGLAVSSGAAQVGVRVEGVWRITTQPEGRVGVFDLRQDGTVLSGTYRFTDGRQGSLRGTLTADRVRLDLLDSRRGFDGTFFGELNGARTVLTGQWTPAELADGGPGGGSWRGTLTGEDPEETP